MHSYPGLGLPLRHHPQEYGRFYPTGHHQRCDRSQSKLLLVREVAMMHIMDRLTDKPDWHKKVFDDTIVLKWRAEALAYPDEALWTLAANKLKFNGRISITGIMTEKMFDYCLQELRDKAQHFAKTGIVQTLDATAAVAKSDGLIPPTLKDELRQAFERLKTDQADSPDWHPGTDEKVLNLVHPSMYPLVIKSTKVFRDEVVGVTDAIAKWAGKGTVIGDQLPPEGANVPAKFWSDDYQWLPSNVASHNDGSVKFTSYINNLHPTKYPEIYSAIEKLVEKALPLWDQCLYPAMDNDETGCAGRRHPRFSLPWDAGDDNEANWSPSSWKELRKTKSDVADEHGTGIAEDEEGSGSEDVGSQDSYDDESEEERLQEEWREVRKPVVPEPDPFEEVNYSPPCPLFQKFKDTGLQVIVKMVSIELTPEKPSYPAGSWHVEGQMNEHICATALYYVDSENITTSDLSFRMLTDPYISETVQFRVGQDEYHWLEKVHGIRLGGSGGPCLQNYGNVETPESRLLAFPNVFQHRVSPFQLVDPTKPGHRRFIALWLVDPHIRIISTANVPPQQQDWWLESVFGRSAESQQESLANLPADLVQLLIEKGLIENTQQSHAKMNLPVELLDMVRDYLGESPVMSEEDARAHRLKLMEERTAFNDVADESWLSYRYNFCEH